VAYLRDFSLPVVQRGVAVLPEVAHLWHGWLKGKGNLVSERSRPSCFAALLSADRSCSECGPPVPMSPAQYMAAQQLVTWADKPVLVARVVGKSSRAVLQVVIFLPIIEVLQLSITSIVRGGSLS
jgi:hypothetical protein